MKLVVLLVLFGVALSDLSLEWDKFKRDYNKNYASAAEEMERKEIFIENINRMRAYQQTYPDASFTMTINYLADRRIQELVSRPKIHIESRPTIRQSSSETKNLPESLDWRDKGVIGPVSGLAGEIVTAVVSTGVYDDPTCSQTQIDQAVQIVGYGIEEGKPYWLCKNNWGTGWGDQGYIRIARGKNMCAIATLVIQVAITEPSSTTQLSTSTTTQVSTSSATQSSTSSTTQSSTSSTTQSSTSTSSATQLYVIGSIHLMVIFVMVTIAQNILIYN
ncbi:unnamed protein product [Adineta steineri]|uniref:Uncharacterized protein n=1 Tax=Adineta steineri TaxID=433720 RepID=A0A815DNI2_9BILA|nr:unnamed protein product [Adineta steineri]CAF3976660.1 unnamed protein product [Adineta steineri]